MIHAKTAVADGRWAGVGSTNLNIASWLGNCELDAVIENHEFARQMEDQYVADLTNATEVVLDERSRVSAPGEPRHPVPAATSGGGSGGRAAAGVIRISNAVGAALTSRVLQPVVARLILFAGILSATHNEMQICSSGEHLVKMPVVHAIQRQAYSDRQGPNWGSQLGAGMNDFVTHSQQSSGVGDHPKVGTNFFS